MQGLEEKDLPSLGIPEFSGLRGGLDKNMEGSLIPIAFFAVEKSPLNFYPDNHC